MTETSETVNGEASVVVCETEWISFRRSRIHGMGGFARKDVPAGTQVIEYVGRRVTKAESLQLCEANNPFVFALDDEHDLDGSGEWNLARFINHSCEANCETELDEEEGRVWIQALRDIKAGEELSFNYGYDLSEYRDHPCQCGAPNCVGFIVAEEFFDHVRRQLGLARAVEQRT